MKYFLTGATGFVGGRLAAMLRDRSHEVIALVRNPEKATSLREIGVTVTEGDVTDKESMRPAMEGCDGVFHVAGWYKIGVRDKTPGQKINVDGTRNVLELMKELEVPKGVYTSTLAVNSDSQGKMYDENYRFTGKHISEYDRTKAEAHDIALQFIEDGLPLVIVMPGLIYGPDGTSMSDEAFRMYLKRKLPVIPKKSAFCWAHVDDTAEAHILALEKGKSGETYIIAGPKHEVTETFSIAQNITDIRAPLSVPPVMLKMTSVLTSIIEKIIPLPDMYTSESLRVQAGVTYLGDNSKAKRELDFNPRSLEIGLKETLSYEMGKIRKMNR